MLFEEDEGEECEAKEEMGGVGVIPARSWKAARMDEMVAPVSGRRSHNEWNCAILYDASNATPTSDSTISGRRTSPRADFAIPSGSEACDICTTSVNTRSTKHEARNTKHETSCK